MRTLLFFLLLTCAIFSQTEKKKEVKPVSKTVVVAKKTPEIKKVDSKKAEIKKEDVKKIDAKKVDSKQKIAEKEIKKNDSIKKNDTIVRISKIAIDDAPIIEKEMSYDIGFRLLNSCNTSKLKKFTELEFTKSLLKKIKLSYISAICVNNNQQYGKFQSLELAEVLTHENIKTNIYRYKILYERKLLKKELRIYINKDGLVSVIKTLKWRDKFEPKKKPKPKPKKIIVDTLTIIDESFIIRN
jgi:hypothetical protein